MNQEPIYGRIKDAISAEPGCAGVFLGANEWWQLCSLCKKWGHDWPPGGDDYNPQMVAAMRGTFLGKPIYRVDAADFLGTMKDFQ